MKTGIFRWSFFITYGVCLFILFTLPPEQIPEMVARVNDKVLHFLDFFILVLLAFRAFFYSSSPSFYFHAGRKAVGFSLFYGAFLEWVQLCVPGRKSSLSDWIADALGVVIGSFVFRISGLTRPS